MAIISCFFRIQTACIKQSLNTACSQVPCMKFFSLGNHILNNRQIICSVRLVKCCNRLIDTLTIIRIPKLECFVDTFLI